jgi:hypothetical protein
MPQYGDDLFLGVAVAGGPGPAEGAQNPSPISVGVGPLGRIYSYDIVPVTLGTALLAALQTLAGAGNFVLAAGAGVTTRVVNGVTRFVLDVPRSVTLTSAANMSAVTMTVNGFDVYGQAMTQTIAGPNANTVSTLKAFKEIVSVAANGAVASTVSIGIGDVFGLPFRLLDINHIISVKWASALAQDASTVVAAVTTSPSTAALGDVRGTVAPSSASNGARRLTVNLFIPGIGSGPNASRVGAYGVTQV